MQSRLCFSFTIASVRLKTTLKRHEEQFQSGEKYTLAVNTTDKETIFLTLNEEMELADTSSHSSSHYSVFSSTVAQNSVTHCNIVKDDYVFAGCLNINGMLVFGNLDCSGYL